MNDETNEGVMSCARATAKNWSSGLSKDAFWKVSAHDLEALARMIYGVLMIAREPMRGESDGN